MIIMKFGGSSLGNADRIRHVAKLVKSRLREKPVVVVSAVGGITDLLLEGAEKSLGSKNTDSLLAQIKEVHSEVTTSLGIDRAFLITFLQELSTIYKGIKLLREFSPRTWDLVASFGERISARIMAAALEKDGVHAVALDAWEAGFITTSDYTQSRLLPEAPLAIRKIITSLRAVPVITGFIGKDRQGHITTLGRGGSDFTASLIGASIGAKAIEIWTDVSGIMTADPRLIPEAHPLALVSFQEAAELSAFGAKVLHPNTIEPAVKKKIPVLVKNTFKPNDPGTTIISGHVKEPNLKAISLKKGITTLNIYSSGMLEARGFLAKVFNLLEKHGLVVDVVTTSEVNVSMTLDHTDGLAAAKAELSEFADIDVVGNRAIICIVGEGLKSTPGISGRVFNILGKEKINVEMISLGASQINLTFVVDSKDAARAVKSLHRELFE